MTRPQVHPDQAGPDKRRDHGVCARLLPEGGETDALPGAEPQGQGLQADLLRGEGFARPPPVIRRRFKAAPYFSTDENSTSGARPWNECAPGPSPR